MSDFKGKIILSISLGKMLRRSFLFDSLARSRLNIMYSIHKESDLTARRISSKAGLSLRL